MTDDNYNSPLPDWRAMLGLVGLIDQRTNKHSDKLDILDERTRAHTLKLENLQVSMDRHLGQIAQNSAAMPEMAKTMANHYADSAILVKTLVEQRQKPQLPPSVLYAVIIILSVIFGGFILLDKVSTTKTNLHLSPSQLDIQHNEQQDQSTHNDVR